MTYENHLSRVAERKSRLQNALAEALQGQTKVVLEIGCGHGHWLVDFAVTHPEKFCLGIDISSGRIGRANKKRRTRNLENVRFVLGEARETLESLPAGILFTEVFVLFPDPWPKKRHWKNRLIQHSFLDELAQKCSQAAWLYFRTDHSGYMEWATDIALENKSWKPAVDQDWPFERETIFQSKATDYQSLILSKT